MTTERIEVRLGRDRTAITQGATRYVGTTTGAFANAERYEVTCHGVVCEGTWDGDSRHDVYVGSPSPELRHILIEQIRARRKSRLGA